MKVGDDGGCCYDLMRRMEEVVVVESWGEGMEMTAMVE